MNEATEAQLLTDVGHIRGVVEGMAKTLDRVIDTHAQDKQKTDKRIDDAHSRISKVAEQRGNGKVKFYVGTALGLLVIATGVIVRVLG